MNKASKQGAAVGPLLWALALAAVLLAVSFSATGATGAHAQVKDGGTIVFGECSIVTVTVQDSDANFTSVFWRFGPDGALGITSKQVNESALIGEVPADQELILGIVVTDTGNTFKTGPADRNPDNQVHAIVGGNTVGFEDKAEGEPFADFDYDDAVLVISTEPCPRPEQVTLTVDINPASTGTGGVAGAGTFDINAVANPSATPDVGSTFGGWSGDCGGFAQNIAVVMDMNRACFALFEADEPPVDPTPTPTPEPPIALPSTVGIDNNLVSPNPARVGETVTFRVNVALSVPAENVADVQYTFDDSELDYQSASWNDVTLNQCSLSGAGVIDCAFGNVSTAFAFDLNFEALTVADDSTTNATLSSDPDGAGPEAAIPAGPAAADVDIIAISGGIPDTGDGSVAAGSGTGSFQLFALLGVTVLATVAGAAKLRTGARS